MLTFDLIWLNLKKNLQLKGQCTPKYTSDVKKQDLQLMIRRKATDT